MAKQQTLARKITMQGIAVHSGNAATLHICPAPANHGILFKRIDLTANNIIPASYDAVVETTMCTVIANQHNVKVMTIEHLMAALWGCGIDNALIEIDGKEVPIMDGSSQVFVENIKNAGIKKQNSTRHTINLPHTITVIDGDKVITMEPADHFSIACEIEFDHHAIGEQSFAFDSATDKFEDIVAGARTFGFAKDLQRMQKIGLAMGASLENTIGIDESGVMNQGGLRYDNEFARHKVLDCIGDFALAGATINAKITVSKPGHQINNKALHQLFNELEANAEASHIVTVLNLSRAFK